MQRGDALQRVCIYLNERDQLENRALYIVVLEHLQHEGATGATALRGMGGFGPGHRMRAARSLSVTETQTVVIEWIDRIERVSRVLPTLDALTRDALITVEDIYAYRARLPVSSQFGSQSAGEVMLTDVALGNPGMTARDGIALLVEAQQDLLPILDEQKRVVATLSESDFMRRAELAYPLRIVRAMRPAERTRFLDALPAHTLAEVRIEDPRSAYVQATIPQVVGLLSEWGLAGVAVVDREGSFVGLITLQQVLQAALTARQQASTSATLIPEQAPPVHLLMQTNLPSAESSMPILEALERMLTHPEHFLVLTHERRPVGILDDVQVLQAIPEQLRSEWFKILWQHNKGIRLDFSSFAEMQTTALVQAVATIRETATQDEAVRLLSEQNLERLLVLRDDGTLAGLLSRRAMVRALASEG